MLNLIRNEWMKLWSKKGTWVMTGLIIIAAIGVMGMMKWVNDFSSMGEVDAEILGQGNWEQVIKEELEMTTATLEQKGLKAEEKKQLEGNKKVLEYRLSHSIEPLVDNDRNFFIASGSTSSLFVLLMTVIVAAGIVAAEFSQGTIKMLLTRPIKRWKILTSKYLTVLLFGFVLMIIDFIVMTISAYMFFPVGAGKELIWNGKEVVEASVWGHGLYMLLLEFGGIIILATFAFMVGTIFRSNGMAVGLSLFIYFTGPIVVLQLQRYEIAKYLLFANSDLTMYETGYIPLEGLTLPFSLAVLAVYLVIFLVISFTSFIKRDITA